MERDVKFRGKQHTWVVGGFHKASDGTCSIHTDFETFTVDPKSVGEYTGIKDKNGSEIFEGDILQVDNNKSIDKWMRGETGEVKFIPARFTLCLKNGDKKMLTEDFEDCVEVIGNIYDNPDMI